MPQARTRVLAAAALVLLGAPAAAHAARGDGAERVPITNFKGSAQNPCFSPLGDRLAFTVWHRGYNRAPASVRIVPLAGGAASVFSPDSSRVSVNLPGTCWNPVTDEIVYAADFGDGEQVTIQPAGGGAPKAITPGRMIGYEPSFSPDGQRVVFEAHPNDRERGELYVVNRDGSGLRRITRGRDDRQPNWSPTSNRIVFQRIVRGLADLWIVDADSGAAHAVTRTRGREETDVSWAPDGERFVFSADHPDIRFANLFAIGSDGEGKRRITRARRYYDGAPSWAPDGRTIAFESRKGEPDGTAGTRIWTIAAPAR